VILAHSAHQAALGMYFFQDSGQTVGFSPMDLWHNMGNAAKAVVRCFVCHVHLVFAVIIDRALYFSAARKQSREFAPRVAGALKEGKLDEAVKVADRNKKSHLAEVSPAGLQEFRQLWQVRRDHRTSRSSPSKRALRAFRSHRPRQVERGLGGLARLVRRHPLSDCSENGGRYLERLPTDRNQKTSGIGASRRRYLWKPCHHSFSDCW